MTPMNYKIPFSGRAHAYTEDELQTIIDVAQGAVPLTQGSHLQEFEAAFKEYAKVNYAFAVNNATAALELSAQLCQFKPGDEVIIPSHTFTASAYPFVKKGARIVWLDIDPITRVVTAETFERAVTPKTRAVVVVHLYGYGANMPEITRLAKKHNILLIEDTAQALGADIEGKMAGTYGDFGVFSFHSHKNITTLGEGGMLVVKDDNIAKIIPQLRHNGHCAFDFERQDYWIPAMGNVDIPKLNGEYLMPNNYCIGEVECALGVKLLQRIDMLNAEKRMRALRFIDALVDYPQLQFHRVATVRHNYHLLVARIENGLRDAFIRSMAQEYGIQCVVQYYPLNRYPFYQKSGYGEAACPHADDFFDNMVSFPFQHTLSEEELDYIISSIRAVLTKLAA